MYIFICLLTILFEKCYLQDPSSNTILKKKYQSSLHQVNAFLADVEKNIKREREILDNFHYEELMQVTGYMDYDVTDIWWPEMPGAPVTASLGTPRDSIPPGYIGIPVPTENLTDAETEPTYPEGAVGSPLPEFPPSAADLPDVPYYEQAAQHPGGATDATEPAAHVSPTGHRQGPGAPDELPPWLDTTTQWTHPFQVPPETTPSPTETTNYIFGEVPDVPSPTTLSPFLEQMEEDMEKHRAGYFTVFAIKLSEILAKKSREHNTALMRPVEGIVQDMSGRGVLFSLREPLYSTVMSTSQLLAGMPGDLVKSEATMFYSLLSNRHVLMAPDTRAVLDYADTIFDDEQAERMFNALEDLEKFPHAGNGAHATSLEVVNSVMEPYFHLAGTAKRDRLVLIINTALKKRLVVAPPGRRSLAGQLNNYEKLIRKIFHPKRDRHGGRRKHRHPAHAHRAHGNRDRAHGSRDRALKIQNKAIEHENKQYSKTNKRQAHKKIKKRFNIIQRRNNELVDEDRRALRSGRVRRNETRGAAAARPTKNRLLRKIMKDSEDSDEARRFRVNVYDALYHGNRSSPLARRAADLSSGSDQEVVLKTNIYRYFGYDPDVEIGDASEV